MSTSLAEFIQKKIGYPPLQKVDPVDHEIKHLSERTAREKLAQAAIPAVLSALYRFTRTEDYRKSILSNQPQPNWLDSILEDKEQIVVDKVAHYSGVSRQDAKENMLLIAIEAIHAIRESVVNNPTHASILKFMSEQRHSILVYLPAEMQLGSLLDDGALDDRTNKMEGPMSNLAHSIENKFARGGE